MLENENIYLRPIAKTDILILNQWKNDEETYRYLGGGFRPTSLDEQEKWMDTLISHEGNNRRFMICRKDNDQPIGMIGLYGIHWINRTCELGIFIGEKELVGKGYGSGSCDLLASYAKAYLNLRKLKVHVVSENTDAVKLYVRLGFKKVGAYEKERYIRGAYHDVLLMEKFL